MARGIRVTTQVRLVKIAPDKQARLWKACVENKCIGVGWSKVGNLRRFHSPEELAAEMKSKYYPISPSTASRKAKELWTLTLLQPGDQIVANKGISKVVGVGTVRKPAYSFGRRSLNGYRHIVAVDWHTVYGKPKRVSTQTKWNNTTVADVSPELFSRLTRKGIPRRSEVVTTPVLGSQDARERVERSVVQREGQPEFRNRLIDLYERRCAISGCQAVEALEAAHVLPYKGRESNQPWNGILIRADLHLLFDKNLLTIAPATLRVRLSPRLTRTEYSRFQGVPIHLPPRWSKRLLSNLLKRRARELARNALA